MNDTLGAIGLPIGMEFSLMPRDMVRKPQGKPVMECRDMKVDFSPGCEAHSVRSNQMLGREKS
jgi:hypothetical protein